MDGLSDLQWKNERGEQKVRSNEKEMKRCEEEERFKNQSACLCHASRKCGAVQTPNP